MNSSTGSRIAVAVVIGIVTGIVVYLLGVLLVDLTTLDGTGAFLKNISGLVGILAGVYTYFTRSRLV